MEVAFAMSMIINVIYFDVEMMVTMITFNNEEEHQKVYDKKRKNVSRQC